MSLISSTAFIKAEKRWCQWAIIFCHLAFQWSLTKHCSKALSQHSFFLFFSPLRSCKVCLLFFGEWLHLHLHVHFLFLELEVRLLKLTVLLSSFTVASFRLCPAYILTCGISLFGLINSLALLERYLTNCPTREDPVLCFCGRLALFIGCFTLSGTDGAYWNCPCDLSGDMSTLFDLCYSSCKQLGFFPFVVFCVVLCLVK